jgi:hypothetical protein
VPTIDFFTAIHLRHDIDGHDLPRQHYSFSVPLSETKRARVTIEADLARVMVEVPDWFISEQLREWLDANAESLQANSYPSVFAGEIENLRVSARSAAATIIDLMRWVLGINGFAVEPLGPARMELWNDETGRRRSFPPLIAMSGSGGSSLYLSSDVAGQLEEGLELGYRVLRGTRHLYSAFAEPIPALKWIAATTAAELCVKDALVRADPSLQARVNAKGRAKPDVPLLYGQLLFAALGERSPFARDLQLGAERRNELVHNPGAHDPTEGEALAYVNTVHMAVQHIYRLLYRTWPLAQHLGTRVTRF